MIKINTSIAILISTIVVGCATIVSGTTQQVTFQSSPDDALIKVNGRILGKTPLTIRLDKASGQTLTIEKDGYKTFTTSMDTSIEPMFFGNIIIGGLLGSTTDGISGAINNYTQDQYIITLEPLTADNYTSTMHLSKREYARRFMFVNYKKLKTELSINSGEVIDASFELLDISDKNKEEATEQMKRDILTESEPALFIEKTLDRYLKTA